MKNSNRKKKKSQEMLILNPNAAGIDIGSREHFVAVPEGRDTDSVRSFGCFTPDIHKMAKWLKKCGIETVAMESTGVYWIPVFQILEEYGLEVFLVNARHVKNVSGRKTDVSDCQWLQQLHSFGLLSASFLPEKDIYVLRSYWRHRKSLVSACSREIQLMQKSLEQMNLQLHKVLSDITGVTGMDIIRAILAGQRNPVILAKLRHPLVKSKKEDIAKALTGDYREEHLFTLRQAVEAYDFYQKQIADCDAQISGYMKTFEDKSNPEKKRPEVKTATQKRRKNQPHFDLRTELCRMTGVDLIKIDGIDSMTALTIISECGFDMSQFKTEKHFASWLGLCPNNKITGGKKRSSKSRKVKNRASDALRVAAQSLHKSKTALGAFYRRMRMRLGAPKAITATAHKLARIIYRMLKYGDDYVDIGQEYYENRYKERVLKNLKNRANELGYSLLNIGTGELVS